MEGWRWIPQLELIYILHRSIPSATQILAHSMSRQSAVISPLMLTSVRLQLKFRTKGQLAFVVSKHMRRIFLEQGPVTRG